MLSILNDKRKFIVDVPSDDIKKLEGKVTSHLVKLRGIDVIDKQEFNSLKPMGSDFANLYGLPKIHKVDNPLHPILSMCNSPTHKLAKWLADILSPVRNELCKFTLKDTFELVDCLVDMTIKNRKMYSFDVNSLFTNVPLVKTVDILCDYISSTCFSFPFPLTYLKDLLLLLLLCSDNVTFEGEHFRQMDGDAVSSPLGPLLADVYMSYVENLSFDLISKLSFYKRYVDDIILICDDHEDASSLLDRLNSVQNHISLLMWFCSLSWMVNLRKLTIQLREQNHIKIIHLSYKSSLSYHITLT
ncbi:unnamed protein product [Trichobilharzia regenti]|nr:unnamed protein product [Trichobilharzia regenti]